MVAVTTANTELTVLHPAKRRISVFEKTASGLIGEERVDNRVKVLFLCRGDASRGQIAEGFLNAESGGRFAGTSASTASPDLNPLAIEVMREVGIDISTEKSKTVREVFKERFSYVVGICNKARERCPVFPFTYKLIQWSVDDPLAISAPREEQIRTFRTIRDQIRENVQEFLKNAAAESGKAFAARVGR